MDKVVAMPSKCQQDILNNIESNHNLKTQTVEETAVEGGGGKIGHYGEVIPFDGGEYRGRGGALL